MLLVQVTLERSTLEQADSRYELEGEYVLPGTREHAGERERESETESDGILEQAIPGQLRGMITSIGRWRLRLDVPRAQIAEMLPAARILSGSHDPAELFRSKELFLSGVEASGFMADSLQDQLQVSLALQYCTVLYITVLCHTPVCCTALCTQ